MLEDGILGQGERGITQAEKEVPSPSHLLSLRLIKNPNRTPLPDQAGQRAMGRTAIRPTHTYTHTRAATLVPPYSLTTRRVELNLGVKGQVVSFRRGQDKALFVGRSIRIEVFMKNLYASSEFRCRSPCDRDLLHPVDGALTSLIVVFSLYYTIPYLPTRYSSIPNRRHSKRSGTNESFLQRQVYWS
jgi:hypothetical protein